MFKDLLVGATTTTTGKGVHFNPPNNFAVRKVMATIAGTGTVSATVIVEGRTPGKTDWGYEFTIALSGTTTDNFRGSLTDNGGEYRARVSAISGTGATVNVWMEN